MNRLVLSLEREAQAVAQRTGFVIEKEIYRGTFYSADRIRDLIYVGQYQGQSAVLKIYNDPRLTDEPKSLADFHAHNASSILIAPQLFAFELTTPHDGWMIMEKLPAGGHFFTQPLAQADRQEFLTVYTEYRTHFPTQPTRELELAERLPAEEFTSLRMSRWLNMAHEKDAELAMRGEQRTFTDARLKIIVEGMKFVRIGLTGTPMIWCHGHFKPQEVYKTLQGKYYLLDFAHTHLFPEGYEFGFMVWADQLMTITEKTTVEQLLAEIANWQKDFAPIAQDLGWKDFSKLSRVSVAERIIGTVLADVGASEQSRQEKHMKIDLLLSVFQQLMH